MPPYTLERLRQLLQRSIQSGTFISTHFKTLQLTSASGGRCTAEIAVDKHISNTVGTLQGGMAATLVDVVSTYALLTLSDVRNVSVDMSMSYLAKAKIGEVIMVEAYTSKLGRTTAFLTVDLRSKDTGKLLVKGLHTKHLSNEFDYLGNKVEGGNKANVSG